MKIMTCLVICATLSINLLNMAPASADAAKANGKCQAYAKARADKKMGPKYVENAIVVGATGGLAGKAVDGKKTFTGFGLGGAAIGVIVANNKRMKLYKQYYARCMHHA
jgi:hypothetical protein